MHPIRPKFCDACGVFRPVSEGQPINSELTLPQILSDHVRAANLRPQLHEMRRVVHFAKNSSQSSFLHSSPAPFASYLILSTNTICHLRHTISYWVLVFLGEQQSYLMREGQLSNQSYTPVCLSFEPLKCPYLVSSLSSTGVFI